MTDFTGTDGNDVLKGKGGDDLFDLSQGGDDRANGAGGDDTFYFGGTFTAADQVIGGKGDDTLELDGDYWAGLTFGAKSINTVETIQLDANHSYHLTTVDGNVAGGQVMNVDASGLSARDRVTFDGSAETNGAFSFSARAAKAVFIGGHGDDFFVLGDRLGTGGHSGGGGGDKLTGGDGADTFTFLSLSKAGARPHEITDLTSADKIDISNLDADTHTVGDQAFHLVSAFTGHAGEAALVLDIDTGDTMLELDTNGDGKSDANVLLDGDHTDFTNFVL